MEAKPGEALAEYKRLSGIMKQDLPDVMKNVGGLFQAALPAGALSAKEKALIGLGISVASTATRASWFSWRSAWGPGRPGPRFWRSAAWPSLWAAARPRRMWPWS